MRRASLVILSCFVPATWLVGQQPPRSSWLTEEMRIGSLDGPDALSRVTAITIDSDGSTYLLQPQERLIRRFSADGEYQASIGRGGRGPGEFERPETMGWVADTLWVFDSPSGRLNLYVDGVPVESRILNLPEPDREYSRVIPIAVNADRTVLGRMLVRLVGDRFASANDRLVQFDQEGRVLSTVSESEPILRAMILSTGTSIMVGSFQPFADNPLWEVSSDGRALVVVERTAANSPRASTFNVIKLVLPTLDTAFAREIHYTPRPIKEVLVDSVARTVAKSISNSFPSLDAASRQVRRALYAPRFHPPVTGIVVGMDGSVWLRREDEGNGLVRWDVLSREGGPLGFAYVPPDLRLVAARADVVWSLERDALGVDSIVRYRVEVMSAEPSRRP